MGSYNLDEELTKEWIAVSLHLVRAQKISKEDFANSFQWIIEFVEQESFLPPLGLIIDIGFLVHGDYIQTPNQIPIENMSIRHTFRLYEDHLLSRIYGNSHFEAIVDAVTKLPKSKKSQAVTLITKYILKRLNLVEKIVVKPGIIRKLLSRPVIEILNLGLEKIQDLNILGGNNTKGCFNLLKIINETYTELVQKAQYVDNLLTGHDVFIIENLETLYNQGQRLAIEQIIKATEQLEKNLPKHLIGRSRKGSIESNFKKEESYPTGGFSSISNVGNIENLVTSELVYMNEVDSEDDIDLFDVRYAEGELLFYLRDENVFMRHKRMVNIVLLEELQYTRLKDIKLPWQKLVIVCALLFCLIRKMVEWLKEEELVFNIYFLSAGSKPLRGEYHLFKLLFNEWIENGVVTLNEIKNLDEAIIQTIESSGSLSDLLVIGTNSLYELPSNVRWTKLDVNESCPSIITKGKNFLSNQKEVQPWDVWIKQTYQLLKCLL